ncbi:PQQ-binding-like beta-propeller repeat protein [Plantactinospora siamensis]|uniref:PQQ-binding-like beta-propeller repeat protein n=1 Tax=Plantactinospora siamensis TaxID=555372 RepID=A0ABV6P648_9ACTN
MAKGNGPCVKCWLAFAAVAVVILAVTGVWNPFPKMWQWASSSRALSDPKPAWQQQMGGTPTTATIAGDAVVVEERTVVEARSRATGVQLWQRKADWAAVAGDGPDAVVLVGKLLTRGYDVLDPTSGTVRRKDTSAQAVWAYRNALLDARCSSSTDCTLTAWDPRGSTALWSTFIPGVSTGLTADSPRGLNPRPIDARQVDDDAAGPQLMPPLLGLPVDGKVVVVDTAIGRVVQNTKPAQEDRVVVVGGRVVRVQARSADGTCYFTVTATDPANGQEVWRRTGLNLRTADGAGCAQRENPQGGQNVLVGVGADGRELVLDAYDGRQLWTGAAGEKLLAVDDRYAVARAGDQKSVNSHELAFGGLRWTRSVDAKAAVALTPYAAVVIDNEPDRIIAVDPRTGRELVNVHSTAKVLAVGPAGMVIGDGRDIGYLPFGTIQGAPGPAPGRPVGSPTGDGNGDGVPATPAPTCGGPKNEVCPPPADGAAG